MVLALCSLGQQREKGGFIDSILALKILIGTNTRKIFEERFSTCIRNGTVYWQWDSDHPEILQCLSDGDFFFRRAGWCLPGILGFRKVVVFADLNPTFPFNLRDIQTGNL